MMPRSWGLCAALLLATSWWAPPAHAQTCAVEMLPGEIGLGMPVGQGMIKEMPDGDLWFGEATSIARVGAASPHPIEKFAIDTPAGVTNDIAAGADGNYWFTEIIGNKIGRIDPDDPQAILEVPLPLGASQPDSIVSGPDGHLWFTQWSGQIGRLSPEAPEAILQYGLPHGGVPREIIAGRNGVLWYTNPATNSIGRITPLRDTAPQLREFPVPTENARPVGLAEDRDGTIWFTEFLSGRVGWFDPSTPEAMTEFALSSPSSAPVDIAVGHDGDLWVTETGTDLIGRLHPGDRRTPPTLTECSVPDTPWFLDVAADGAIWFTTFHDPGIKIGRITAESRFGGPDTDEDPGGGAGGEPPTTTVVAPSSPAPPAGRLPSTGHAEAGVIAGIGLAVAGLLLRRLSGVRPPGWWCGSSPEVTADE